jgi:hypothetical protein
MYKWYEIILDFIHESSDQKMLSFVPFILMKTAKLFSRDSPSTASYEVNIPEKRRKKSLEMRMIDQLHPTRNEIVREIPPLSIGRGVLLP